MDDLFNQPENNKNIYVIRHKLNDLKRLPWSNRYELQVGPFVVKIFPDGHGDPTQHQYITQYEEVDVGVYEPYRSDDGTTLEQLLSLRDDPRFKNYRPIQYNVIETSNGSINLSDGNKMPIHHLCELIRYLYRLANLTAFM
jgi:hypothetical protein